jgi:hypothetical protein
MASAIARQWLVSLGRVDPLRQFVRQQVKPWNAD